MRDSLGIISDFCIAYKTDLRNFLDIQLINDIINRMKIQLPKSESDKFIKMIEFVRNIFLYKTF